jgi:hypothetical protein
MSDGHNLVDTFTHVVAPASHDSTELTPIPPTLHTILYNANLPDTPNQEEGEFKSQILSLEMYPVELRFEGYYAMDEVDHLSVKHRRIKENRFKKHIRRMAKNHRRHECNIPTVIVCQNNKSL